MNLCPKCRSILNNDEKASGKCFTCGETFESILPSDTVSPSGTFSSSENAIGRVLKIIGIVILIVGTIGSFAGLFYDVYGQYKFSLTRFFVYETCCIVSGIMFLGFGEIIRLLQEISNKHK